MNHTHWSRDVHYYQQRLRTAGLAVGVGLYWLVPSAVWGLVHDPDSRHDHMCETSLQHAVRKHFNTNAPFPHWDRVIKTWNSTGILWWRWWVITAGHVWAKPIEYKGEIFEPTEDEVRIPQTHISKTGEEVDSDVCLFRINVPKKHALHKLRLLPIARDGVSVREPVVLIGQWSGPATVVGGRDWYIEWSTDDDDRKKRWWLWEVEKIFSIPLPIEGTKSYGFSVKYWGVEEFGWLATDGDSWGAACNLERGLYRFRWLMAAIDSPQGKARKGDSTYVVDFVPLRSQLVEILRS